ncbi:19710_t:CDS:2 [Rhizophagus irregularis]|nr:19710_t:CDS:2 [Rhizophagus irregularis]
MSSKKENTKLLERFIKIHKDKNEVPTSNALTLPAIEKSIIEDCLETEVHLES